jgi:hypothetical protein
MQLAGETATKISMGSDYASKRLSELDVAFHTAARNDLGHPSSLFSPPPREVTSGCQEVQ